MKKIFSTAILTISLCWQAAIYPLLTGRSHPAFDGAWRYRYELRRVWR